MVGHRSLLRQRVNHGEPRPDGPAIGKSPSTRPSRRTQVRGRSSACPDSSAMRILQRACQQLRSSGGGQRGGAQTIPDRVCPTFFLEHGNGDRRRFVLAHAPGLGSERPRSARGSSRRIRRSGRGRGMGRRAAAPLHEPGRIPAALRDSARPAPPSTQFLSCLSGHRPANRPRGGSQGAARPRDIVRSLRGARGAPGRRGARSTQRRAPLRQRAFTQPGQPDQVRPELPRDHRVSDRLLEVDPDERRGERRRGGEAMRSSAWTIRAFAQRPRFREFLSWTRGSRSTPPASACPRTLPYWQR